MAKCAYVGVNGVARKIKKVYVGVDGVARVVKKAYIGVADLARRWLSQYLVKFSTKTSTHSSFGAITPSAGVDGDTWRFTIKYSLSSYVTSSSRPQAAVNIYGEDDVTLVGKTIGVSGVIYAPDSYSSAVVAFVNSSGAVISSKSYTGSASGTNFNDALTVPSETETILIYIAAGSPGTNKTVELVLNSVTLDGVELI